MIARLTSTEPVFGDRRSAFERTGQQRRLRLLIDEQSIPEGPARQALLGFGHHKLLDVTTLNPADGLATLIVGDHDHEHDVVPLMRHDGDRTTRGAVIAASQFEHMAGCDADRKVIERAEGERLLLLAQAVQALRIDVLVTDAPYLLDNAPRGVVGRANPLTPAAALALVGLFLRLHGDFTVVKYRTFTDTLKRGLFFWVLTRDLLSSGWRWFGACVESSTASCDDAVLLLGQSTLQRYGRVLRARDRIAEQAQLEQHNDTSDESLFYLDAALVALVGAFDAAARVAHAAHAVPGNQRNVGWRRGAWRRALADTGSDLAALTELGEPARDMIDVVSMLRNTVHGAALQGLGYQDGETGSSENLVLVPDGDAAAIVEIAERRGGMQTWGLRNLGGRRLTLEADRFVDALLPACAKALNAIMDSTDVSGLPGNPSGQHREPPDDAPFDAHTRAAIRALAGL